MADACRREEKIALAIAGDAEGSKIQAEEFLYGKVQGSPGQSYASLPADWTAHMSPREFKKGDDFSGYFVDQVTDPQNGHDDVAPNGLESAHLIFYVGHGSVDRLTAWEDKTVYLKSISPGDELTRYLLIVGCRIMAHGPKDKKTDDYSAPQDYAFPGFGQNVFARWTEKQGGAATRHTPLNRNLRLACGGSTEIGFNVQHPGAEFWQYKQIGLPVADAFILGLARRPAVPLCITRGGPDREDTPLYDQDFVLKANPAGDHLYIQYPVYGGLSPEIRAKLERTFHFDSKTLSSKQSDVPPPYIPVLEVGPAPLPSTLRALPAASAPLLDYGFRGGPASLLERYSSRGFSSYFPGQLSDGAQSSDTCVRWNQATGATVLSWKPGERTLLDRSGEERLLSPTDLLTLFDSLDLSLEQWTGHSAIPGVSPILPAVDQLSMQIDGIPEKLATVFKKKDIKRTTKCTYLIFNSQLRIGDIEASVLGAGGRWVLGGCKGVAAASQRGQWMTEGDPCARPSPPALLLSWTGRHVIKAARPTRPVLDLTAARERARAELARRERPAAYREVAHRWGYRAAPPHCVQEKMYVVYEFDYQPTAEQSYKGFPPVTVEVPAHDLGDKDKKIESTWTCPPERTR